MVVIKKGKARANQEAVWKRAMVRKRRTPVIIKWICCPDCGATEGFIFGAFDLAATTVTPWTIIKCKCGKTIGAVEKPEGDKDA